MVNVVINRRKKVLVAANTLTGADMAVTLRNTTAFTAADFRLDRMKDVYESDSVATGDTLVYNSANDTYVVQKLSIEQVANVDVLAIDGGSF
jgi:hypothetical protein